MRRAPDHLLELDALIRRAKDAEARLQTGSRQYWLIRELREVVASLAQSIRDSRRLPVSPEEPPTHARP